MLSPILACGDCAVYEAMDRLMWTFALPLWLIGGWLGLVLTWRPAIPDLKSLIGRSTVVYLVGAGHQVLIFWVLISYFGRGAAGIAACAVLGTVSFALISAILMPCARRRGAVAALLQLAAGLPLILCYIAPLPIGRFLGIGVYTGTA